MQRIVFFLVFFIPLQALADFDGGPALKKAEKSIWRICGSVTGACGSGFFIDENTFITNLHVIDPVRLEYVLSGGSLIELSEFSLRQKDTEEELSLKSVRSLSIPYDLIVLETNEPVEDYLSLTGDSDYDSVFSISYAQHKFTKAYSVGDVIYEDNYRYQFIARLAGSEHRPMYKTRFAGASGSPILNRKAEVVGVLTQANYNALSGMKAGLLNNMLKADESSGIGFIDCKELDINSCFMAHKQIASNYMHSKTNGLTALPEEAEPELGFYLYSFSEREYAILQRIIHAASLEIVPVERRAYYETLLSLSAGLNYQPAVIQQNHMYSLSSQDKNILYDLIVSSDYFFFLPDYVENFYENETEDRRKTLEISLISCAERQFYPCETALSQLKLNRIFASLE